VEEGLAGHVSRVGARTPTAQKLLGDVFRCDLKYNGVNRVLKPEPPKEAEAPVDSFAEGQCPRVFDLANLVN
jgi:hypothetical protein